MVSGRDFINNVVSERDFINNVVSERNLINNVVSARDFILLLHILFELPSEEEFFFPHNENMCSFQK